MYCSTDRHNVFDNLEQVTPSKLKKHTALGKFVRKATVNGQCISNIPIYNTYKTHL